MHDDAFSAVTPPSASTGIPQAQDSRRPVSPTPGAPDFPNTGPKTTKSAPSSCAALTSVTEWQETAITGSDAWPAARQILRASAGEMAFDRRWTPSAPAARAISPREVIKIRLALLAARTVFTTARASCASSPGARFFPRPSLQSILPYD